MRAGRTSLSRLIAVGAGAGPLPAIGHALLKGFKAQSFLVRRTGAEVYSRLHIHREPVGTGVRRGGPPIGHASTCSRSVRGKIGVAARRDAPRSTAPAGTAPSMDAVALVVESSLDTASAPPDAAGVARAVEDTRASRPRPLAHCAPRHAPAIAPASTAPPRRSPTRPGRRRTGGDRNSLRADLPSPHRCSRSRLSPSCTRDNTRAAGPSRQRLTPRLTHQGDPSCRFTGKATFTPGTDLPETPRGRLGHHRDRQPLRDPCCSTPPATPALPPPARSTSGWRTRASPV